MLAPDATLYPTVITESVAKASMSTRIKGLLEQVNKSKQIKVDTSMGKINATVDRLAARG